MMRWKHLYGVASSMLQKFADSAEHFAYLAQLHQLAEVEIDWLTMSFNPQVFDIDRNRNLVALCRDNLARLIPITDVQTVQLHVAYQCHGVAVPRAVYTLRVSLHDGRHATTTVTRSPQLVAP